jgi:hypothetical protein
MQDYPFEKAAKDILLFFIDPYKFVLRMVQAIKLKWKHLEEMTSTASPMIQKIVHLAVALHG